MTAMRTFYLFHFGLLSCLRPACHCHFVPTAVINMCRNGIVSIARIYLSCRQILPKLYKKYYLSKEQMARIGFSRYMRLIPFLAIRCLLFSSPKVYYFSSTSKILQTVSPMFFAEWELTGLPVRTFDVPAFGEASR